MLDDKSNIGVEDHMRIKINEPKELRDWGKTFGVRQSRAETTEIKRYVPRWVRCESQRIMQALSIAILAFLPMSPAVAQHLEMENSGADESALEITTSADSSAVDISVAPVIIEAERLYPERPLDNVERKLSSALGPPPVLVASERQFTDGATEVTTRFGRFCAKPLSGYLQPGVGGSITLAARCASY